MTATWPGIEVVHSCDPEVAVWVRINCDLDLATEHRARRDLRKLSAGAAKGGRVIVEFAPDVFVSVIGLSVLLEAARLVQAGCGRFAVVHPPPSLRRMHDRLEVGSALPLYHRAMIVDGRTTNARVRLWPLPSGERHGRHRNAGAGRSPDGLRPA